MFIDDRQMRRASAALLACVCMALLLGPAAARIGAQTPDSRRVYLPLIGVAPAANPLEQQIVGLTNELRQQHGCPPLALSPHLTVAARAHSQDMADHNYFGHDDLAGHDPAWRAQHAGYIGTAGWENIAAGFGDAAAVVSAWYNETPPNDGHRRNMLNCALINIGVGYGYNVNSTYRAYWTQDFGQ